VVLLAGHNKPAATSIVNGITPSVVNLNSVVSDGFAAGTGMIISSDGDVLTNNHVVADALSLVGQINGTGPKYDAVVLGVDPTADVAVVRLQQVPKLPVIPIDNTGSVAIGDSVTAIGNALGRNGAPAVVTGHVTSLDGQIQTQDPQGNATHDISGTISFDAFVQPGDSGGHLVNAAGQVIGMDTAANAQDALTHVGFAIPISDAMAIAQQIINGQSSPYIEPGHSGALGIEVADARAPLGALVRGVISGRGAYNAGLSSGDVITAAAGLSVRSRQDLFGALEGYLPGDKIVVTWVDVTGTTRSATVTLSSGPPA
jgi:S1-C subfamily serine protease